MARGYIHFCDQRPVPKVYFYKSPQMGPCERFERSQFEANLRPESELYMQYVSTPGLGLTMTKRELCAFCLLR